MNLGTIMDIISKVLKEMRYLPAYLMVMMCGGGDGYDDLSIVEILIYLKWGSQPLGQVKKWVLFFNWLEWRKKKEPP